METNVNPDDFISSIKEPSKESLAKCEIKKDEKECKSIHEWLAFELNEIKKNKNQ